ncbi:MAG TPA: hypothetical protein VHK90_00925 [Thermoanaerobaculia bacterium]|nr:hypothetical protein [Thermoanaerobaculia bacterium]
MMWLVMRAPLPAIVSFETWTTISCPSRSRSEIDEGGLHSGEDLRHPSFVDVADDGAMPRPLDPQLDDLSLVQHGDPRLVARRIDHDLARHAARIVDCRARRACRNDCIRAGIAPPRVSF